jgi:hypothetical protein
VRARASLLDQRLQVADVRSRTHEGECDEVDADAQRKFEVVDVLASEGRDRDRDAREVDTLVRADDAADDDAAARTAVCDFFDAQPHQPVVDEHVVAGLEHLADDRGRDRKLSVRPVVGADDRDVCSRRDRHRRGQPADADLRPLQVGDQRQRAADCFLHLAQEFCAPRVLFLLAVREVQPGRIRSGLDERAQRVERVASGADRRDDLRAPGRSDGHLL